MRFPDAVVAAPARAVLRGERAGVSHGTRAVISGREPVLVTLKMKPRGWNLRTRRAFARLAPAMFAARDRARMRIAHFSIQRDHVHSIVEAATRDALSRAMQGLSAAAFGGWMGRVVVCDLGRAAAGLVVAPATWLLGVGWRRGGTMFDPDHRPGPAITT